MKKSYQIYKNLFNKITIIVQNPNQMHIEIKYMKNMSYKFSSYFKANKALKKE